MIGQSSSTCRALGLTTGTPKTWPTSVRSRSAKNESDPEWNARPSTSNEHASVDHAVVSAEPGEIDLSLDVVPRICDPPDEQALDARLRSAREAIDECGAAIGKRSQHLVDLASGEHALVQRGVDRRARVLGIQAAGGRRERGLRRDDPVERISWRVFSSPMHAHRGIRCETYEAVATLSRRYRRMPHTDVRRIARLGCPCEARGRARNLKVECVVNARPDSVSAQGGRASDAAPDGDRAELIPIREWGCDPAVSGPQDEPRYERGAQGGLREASSAQGRDPRDVAEAGELAEEVGHGDEHAGRAELSPVERTSPGVSRSGAGVGGGVAVGASEMKELRMPRRRVAVMTRRGRAEVPAIRKGRVGGGGGRRGWNAQGPLGDGGREGGREGGRARGQQKPAMPSHATAGLSTPSRCTAASIRP